MLPHFFGGEAMLSKPGHLALFFLFFLNLFFHFCTAQDTITPGSSIVDGRSLVSGGFELGFFGPRGSTGRYLGLWYKNIPDKRVVWVANRENPLGSFDGSFGLTLDGNLVLRDHSGDIVWSTNTTHTTDPLLQLLDTGNLVLTGRKGLVWQSFDHPSDTLLPGMKLGKDFTKNIERNLTAWKSEADPSPGDYSYRLDPYGAPEIILWKVSIPMYRSGPWSGHHYNGVPEMISNGFFRFNFVASENEMYYEFEVTNSSITSILVLSPAGELQRLVWMNDEWFTFLYYPKDQCDNYGKCGVYGSCNVDNSSVCKCLRGFKPKSLGDWNMRDGSDGCVRKTALNCGKGDGFWKMSAVNLPDTSNATTDISMSLDECRDKCSKNCSCVAFAVISGGSGCTTWAGDLIDIRELTQSGEDLFIRLAASELDSISDEASRKKKKQQLVLVTVITLMALLILLVCTSLFLRSNKKEKGIINDNQSSENTTMDLELPLFDISTIATATDGFSEENKLGKGGFGPVYKGHLADGQEIAVKRQSRNSVQGLDEFKNEVMLIAKLQHRNLVRLLGCCVQGEERMLIYEYMQNGSLDAFIFDKGRGALLNWQKRLDIVLGIARGLLYLHQDSRFKVIHRDLKASNILLDKEMKPKISDFGIARLFKGDQMQENTARVVGTYGYMSPEYAIDGIFSVKSDVFSFGVLVLEILSGKKNKAAYGGEQCVNLLGHMWRLWEEGRCLEILDESLECTYSPTQVLRCIQVGLLCVQEGRDDRPTMSEVVLMLNSESMALPQPQKPGFVVAKTTTKGDRSSSKQCPCTISEITLTVLEGR